MKGQLKALDTGQRIVQCLILAQNAPDIMRVIMNCRSPTPPLHRPLLDLQKQQTLCVFGMVPAVYQKKKAYLVCTPTRYWCIVLQLCLVLNSSVQSHPDRCCCCRPLKRQMWPLCGSWLLPSCACQYPKLMWLCTCGKVTACGPVIFCCDGHYLLRFCHF